jgi:hypothetical protein
VEADGHDVLPGGPRREGNCGREVRFQRSRHWRDVRPGMRRSISGQFRSPNRSTSC